MAFLHFDEPGSGLTALSRIETRIFHSEQEFHGDTSWWTFILVFGWAGRQVRFAGLTMQHWGPR